VYCLSDQRATLSISVWRKVIWPFTSWSR